MPVDSRPRNVKAPPRWNSKPASSSTSEYRARTRYMCAHRTSVIDNAVLGDLRSEYRFDRFLLRSRKRIDSPVIRGLHEQRTCFRSPEDTGGYVIRSMTLSDARFVQSLRRVTSDIWRMTKKFPIYSRKVSFIWNNRRKHAGRTWFPNEVVFIRESSARALGTFTVARS